MENLPMVGIYAGLAGLALLILLAPTGGCNRLFWADPCVAHSSGSVISPDSGVDRSFFSHLFTICFHIRTTLSAVFAFGFGAMDVVDGSSRPWRVGFACLLKGGVPFAETGVRCVAPGVSFCDLITLRTQGSTI